MKVGKRKIRCRQNYSATAMSAEIFIWLIFVEHHAVSLNLSQVSSIVMSGSGMSLILELKVLLWRGFINLKCWIVQ